MKYAKTLLGLVAAAFIFVSCEQSLSDIEAENITEQVNSDLNTEELTSAIETISFNYPIAAFNDDDTTEELNSDEELENYNAKTRRPKIEFPFDITVNGNVVVIENVRDLKQFIKRAHHKRPHVKLVFPVTVINADNSTTEIADKEAMKAYKETLAEGVKPTFQFPISIEKKDGTTMEIADQEALDALIERIQEAKKGHRRPPFKLVFPVTVINTDNSTTEITDQEAMKTYRETLEEGVRPTLQFPISIEDKDGTVIEMADETALKAYVEANKPEKRKK